MFCRFFCLPRGHFVVTLMGRPPLRRHCPRLQGAMDEENGVWSPSSRCSLAGGMGEAKQD